MPSSATGIAAVIATRLGLDASEFRQEIAKAQKAGQEFCEQFEQMGKDVRNAGLMLTAGFTAPLTALVAKSVMATARVDSLDLVIGELAKTSSYSREELMGYVDAIQQAGIEAESSREIIAKFVTAELDASKAAELARIAQNQAVIAGENSTETMGKLTDALITGNAMMFRTMKMTVDLGAGYDDMAKSLGKNVDELTEVERTQARVNAVIEYGSKVQGTYEASMSDSFKQMGSFKRYLNDIFVALGQYFTPALHEGVFGLADLLKELKKNVDEGGKYEYVLTRIGESALKVVEVVMSLVDWFMNLSPAVHQTIIQAGFFLAVLGPMLVVVGQLIITLPKLVTGIQLVTTTLGLLGVSATAAMGVLGALVAVVAAIGVVAANSNAKVNEIKDSIKEASEEAKGSVGSFEDYKRAIEDVGGVFNRADGTGKEYRATMRFLQQELEELRSEGLLIEGQFRKLSYELKYGTQSFEDIARAIYETRINGVKLNDMLKNSVDGWLDFLEVTGTDITDMPEFSVVDQIEAQTDIEEAIRRANEARSETFSLIMQLQESSRSYNETLGGLQERLESVGSALVKAYAAESLTQAQKDQIEALKEEYGLLSGAIKGTADAHAEATKRMIFDLLTQQAMADGLEPIEMQMLLVVGEDMGLIDEGVAEAGSALSALMTKISEQGNIEGGDLAAAEEIINGLTTASETAKPFLDTLLDEVQADGQITEDEVSAIYNYLNDIGSISKEGIDALIDGLLDDSTGANAQLSSVYDWLNKLDGKTVTAELLLSVGGMEVSVEGGGSIVPTIDDRLIIPETDDRTGAMPPMPVQREYPTAHEIAIAMRDAMMAVT